MKNMTPEEIFITKLLEQIEPEPSNVSKLSPTQSVGYIILLRSLYHLSGQGEDDLMARVKICALIDLIGNNSGLEPPQVSSTELASRLN
jgi:hypothetical protein